MLKSRDTNGLMVLRSSMVFRSLVFSGFKIIKDELQLPLRNTASIVAKGYEIDIGNWKIGCYTLI